MKIWEAWDFEPHKRIFYDHDAAIVEAEKAAGRASIPLKHRAKAVEAYAREFEGQWLFLETDS